MYLLDMSVLFDVQPRRPRRESIVGLFQAERMNFCRLAISNEIRVELRRNLGTRQTDPMEAYVDTFPCYPLEDRSDSDIIFSEIAKIVYPHVRVDSLDPNQRSDLRHVITAIQHDLAGLITNDGALVNAAPDIKRLYGLQVVSSSAFEINESDGASEEAFEVKEHCTLRVLAVSAATEPEVREMLSKRLHLSGSSIASAWLPIETQGRIAARSAVWCLHRLHNLACDSFA